MLQEEPLQPLALEPLTEEEQVGLGHWSSILEGLDWEDRWWRVTVLDKVGAVRYLGPHSHPWLPPQRNFSLSVNSVAVLRLMGKGAGPAPGGASRGRGSTRSRGRGLITGWGSRWWGPVV